MASERYTIATPLPGADPRGLGTLAIRLRQPSGQEVWAKGIGIVEKNVKDLVDMFRTTPHPGKPGAGRKPQEPIRPSPPQAGSCGVALSPAQDGVTEGRVDEEATRQVDAAARGMN